MKSIEYPAQHRTHLRDLRCQPPLHRHSFRISVPYQRRFVRFLHDRGHFCRGYRRIRSPFPVGRTDGAFLHPTRPTRRTQTLSLFRITSALSTRRPAAATRKASCPGIGRIVGYAHWYFYDPRSNPAHASHRSLPTGRQCHHWRDISSAPWPTLKRGQCYVYVRMMVVRTAQFLAPGRWGRPAPVWP